MLDTLHLTKSALPYGAYCPGNSGMVSFVFVYSNCCRLNPAFIGRISRNGFAFDLGGVVEFYPARRWAMRFDVGDTVLRRSTPNYITTPNSAGGATVMPAPDIKATTHNLQITAGVGFRF
jgi:hypothetical protein